MLMIAGFVMISCSVTEVEPELVDDSDKEIAQVMCWVDEGEITKSSISPNESLIRNMNVYAYGDGMLVDEAYVTSATSVSLTLPIGYSYNIYAVANMGQRNASPYEEEFVNDLTYSIKSVSNLSPAMPMSCVTKNVYVKRTTNSVRLVMEREVAKVVLSIDKSSILKGLKVTSVRLCQSASVLRPFKWNGIGGSRVESSNEVINGDYATSTDLSRLNAGGEIVLYALENCQGVLLPDNIDPFQKSPQLLGEKEGLCTYLEVKCAFDGSGLLGGDVSYRIYLGLDDCTSFDVSGNSNIYVNLMLTDDGLKMISWKVEADVHVMDGYMKGSVSRGMHDMSELYVGEKLLYEVQFSDELLEYMDGNVSGCTLRLLTNGKEIPGIVAVPFEGNGKRLQTEVLCSFPVEGELYLYAADGRCIGCLDRNVVINPPELVLSEFPVWTEDAPVEKLTFIPECEVNGELAYMCVYFTDADGFSLNGPGSYGFDNLLFDLKDGGAFSGETLLESIRCEYTYMPAKAGNAAASVKVSCTNDGTDHDINLILADIYAMSRELVLNIVEENFSIGRKMKIGLGIPQVLLTLVDNGWAGYHDCQLSMMVDNPSNLPVDVDVWQLITTHASYESTDNEYVEQNLKIDRMEYMTGKIYNGAPPFYGSMSLFCSERNDEGDEALRVGDVLVYPLDGISTSDLRAAINYDKRGAGQMVHVVDATLAGRRIFDDDLTLQDRVSDGSMKYEYLYYSDDSWKYRGAGVYSADYIHVPLSDWAYEYPNLTPLRLTRMLERWDDNASVCVAMSYAPDVGRTFVMTYSGIGNQYGLTVTFDYAGTVNGYVQTYPRGTWYAPQDNYCSAGLSHTKTGVPLLMTGSFVWSDDGEIKTAMDEIYAQSYLDSNKPLGSDAYLHKAHPTSIDMTMSLIVEGDKGYELYPYYITWEKGCVRYYHAQDDKDYVCEMNAEATGFKFSVVRNLNL